MTKPTPQSHYTVWVKDYDGEWYPSGHAHATLTDAANDLTCAVNISQWSFARDFHVQRVDAGRVRDMTAAAACLIIAWNDARDGEAWMAANADHPIAQWLLKRGNPWLVAAMCGLALIDAEGAPILDAAE